MDIEYEYIHWLLASGLGDLAVAPFTDYKTLHHYFNRTAYELNKIRGLVLKIDATFMSIKYDNKGKIDFILTNPVRLLGYTYHHAFPIMGAQGGKDK